VTLAGREGFDGAMFSPRGATTRRPAVLAFGGSEGGTGTGDFPGLVGGVIAASPSSVVKASVEHFDRPAWTLGGKPLPYVHRAEYRDPRPYGAPAAIIGVDRIRGPVFLVCGLDDNAWPKLLAYLAAQDPR
jgi:hypothetical protein